MKAVFSLRWKILGWFCVNLAVVAGALFLLLRLQFHTGSLLSRHASTQIEALAYPLAARLQALPSAQWAGAFDQAAASCRARGVQAAIYGNDTHWIAGDIPTLPADIQQIIDHYDARRRRGFADSPSMAHPTDGGLEKFLLVTGEPRLYWAGVHLDSAAGAMPLPVTLVLLADSPCGGGLFFDCAPWFWIGGGVAILSVLLWLPFVLRLTRVLGQVATEAQQIADGHLLPPTELPRRDELGRINRAHGQIATRIEGFVTGQKRFLGDTAHELLSPLARLEVVLSIFEDGANAEEHGLAEGALAEVHHMAELINELLSFSKAGIGGKNIALKPVALAEIAARVVARDPRIAGLVALEVPGDLRALLEPELFARALSNVLRNSLRYASPISATGESTYSFRPLRSSDGRAAGPITISATKQGTGILLSIADSGPGVPPETLDRLFDPFFRPDTARTRETGGTGLGLAIVKTCIEACGGSVAVRNREPHGLQVDFTLQRAD